jgi:hypothetical protein
MQIKMGSSGALSWEEHETYVLYQGGLFSLVEGQPDLLLNYNNNNNNKNNNNNNTLSIDYFNVSVNAASEMRKSQSVCPVPSRDSNRTLPEYDWKMYAILL